MASDDRSSGTHEGMSPTSGDTDLRDALAEELAEHEISAPRGYVFVVCTCGTEFGNTATARLHVAAVLLPTVRELQAQAAREALLEAADAMGLGMVADWLRARAEGGGDT